MLPLDPDLQVLLIAVPVVAFVVVLLVLRRVMLWYWRINEICARLASIDESLQTFTCRSDKSLRAAAWRTIEGVVTQEILCRT